MVTRREFNRIKKENPESRIGRRSREEQRLRNRLARILIDATKKGIGTPYDEYRGRLTKERQKIELEKNRILQEIDDLAQKKEKDSQQIGKEIVDLKQQKEQEKNRLLREIEKVKQQYKETIGELNEIKHKKPYEIIEHLEQNLDSLSYPEMLKALDLLKSLLENVIKKNRPHNFEELEGDPWKIIEDLKKNHMTINEDAEMYGYKGKIVHVELPSVGGFKGYNFDYFISDEIINLEDYNKIRGNIDYHTKRSVGEFFNNFSRYMKQFGAKVAIEGKRVYAGGWRDADENYEYSADYRYSHDNKCYIGKYIQGLLSLSRCFLGPDMLFTGEDFCFDEAGAVGCSTGHIMAKIGNNGNTTELSKHTKEDSLVDAMSKAEGSSQTFGELRQSIYNIVDN